MKALDHWPCSFSTCSPSERQKSYRFCFGHRLVLNKALLLYLTRSHGRKVVSIAESMKIKHGFGAFWFFTGVSAACENKQN